MNSSFSNNFKKIIVDLFPKKGFSQILQLWAETEFPKTFSSIQNILFSRAVSINSEENELNFNEYNSLDQYFTRKLKPNLRKIDNAEEKVVSPADGKIESYGKINGETLIQAKNINYSLNALLQNAEKADKFKDGAFLTVYLSPKDYHRVHFPYGGKVTSYGHIAGRSYPVGDFSRKNIADLYCKNERVVTFIDTPKGEIAVIMVAAMGVGNMTLSFIESNFGYRSISQIIPSDVNPITINKGDELGIFHLGSTVIILFENNNIDFNDFNEGDPIQMGKAVAQWNKTVYNRSIN